MTAQYGYIRVSGADQNEARQVIAMREAGLDGNHIYIQFSPSLSVLASSNACAVAVRILISASVSSSNSVSNCIRSVDLPSIVSP